MPIFFILKLPTKQYTYFWFPNDQIQINHVYVKEGLLQHYKILIKANDHLFL